MPKAIVIALLVVAALSLWSLASGASYLETTLPGGLPLGNALSAIALCAVAGSAVALSARGTVLRLVSAIALIGAVAWLPVSIALAGNLSLNFYDGQGDAWIILSLAISGMALGTLIWALASNLIARFRRSRTN